MFVFVFLQENGETPEIMSDRDAAMFPLIASATLFGIYIVFQVSTFLDTDVGN